MNITLKICGVIIASALALSLGGCSLAENKAAAPSPSASLAEATPKIDENQFVAGTLVDNIDLTGKTLEEASALCMISLKNKISGITVKVAFGEDVVALSGGDLTYTEIISEYLPQLLKSRKAGNYSLKIKMNTQGIIAALEPMAEKHTVQVKNSTVENFDSESESFTFTPAADGTTVNLTETAKAVAAQFAAGTGGTVDAVMEKKPATITPEDLQKKFTRLSTFTSVSSNNENGNHNMAEALNRVNGVVLNPGEEFSFNGTVGDSTYDGSGFLPAGGLMNGVLIPMYGGGICQVSSTIYGAVLRAGMKITLRECHSSPSSYVPIGLDATVSYDDLDFRFENSLAYPAYIVGYMDDVTLVVTIYGCQPDDWDEIEVSSWEDGTIPIPEGIQFLTDENMAKGQYELKTSGNIGYHAGAQRTYYKDGEVVRTEELPYSIYNATEKTYMVGPGTDTDEIH